MDIEPRFWIRVLLLDDVTQCSLRVAAPFSVISSNGHLQRVKNYKDPVNTPLSIRISDGAITMSGDVLTSGEAIVFPHSPYVFNLNGNDYRGKLRLTVNPDGSTFDVINLVPLEPYLAGVIGAEMPDYWRPAALQAQTIAARTYCLYIKRHFGSTRGWDVSSTQASQVYLGVKAESEPVWDAINRTWGQVLICRYPDDAKDVFPAYYSSTCGGHTEDSEHVFGNSLEPLRGVLCPYCETVAKRRFLSWQTEFDKSYVTAQLQERYPKLKELGQITQIAVAVQSNYGEFSRLVNVELIGSTGRSDFLRAEDFRLAVDPSGRKFKSTMCRIVDMKDKWVFSSGRGYGHGVGMCQYGAEGMARRGNTAKQILSHYYPGSKTTHLY